MERQLTDPERFAILAICRSNVFLTKYMNICMVAAPLLTLFIFTKLGLSFGIPAVFVPAGVVLAIVELLAIRNIQIEMKSILKNTAVCSEHVVVDKIIETGWTSNLSRSATFRHDYVLVNHRGSLLKASYLGRDFDHLGINDEVLLINCGKNLLKKDVYLCFSTACILEQNRRVTT